jgi:hypothetical protein
VRQALLRGEQQIGRAKHVSSAKCRRSETRWGQCVFRRAKIFRKNGKKRQEAISGSVLTSAPVLTASAGLDPDQDGDSGSTLIVETL